MSKNIFKNLCVVLWNLVESEMRKIEKMNCKAVFPYMESGLWKRVMLFLSTLKNYPVTLSFKPSLPALVSRIPSFKIKISEIQQKNIELCHGYLQSFKAQPTTQNLNYKYCQIYRNSYLINFSVTSLDYNLKVMTLENKIKFPKYKNEQMYFLAVRSCGSATLQLAPVIYPTFDIA